MSNEFIEDLPDGGKLIKFTDCPLTIDGAEVGSLKMREPTVADQLAVDHIGSAGKREVAVLANLCETSPENIGSMTMRQYGRLQAAYQVFMS